MANTVMVINLQDIRGIKYKMRVRPNDSVATLKATIKSKLNIEQDAQSLLFMGNTLDDESKLYDHDIQDGCTIMLVVRSIGGSRESGAAIKILQSVV